MCVAPKSGPGREYSIAVDWRDCAWSPPIVVQNRWGEAPDEPLSPCRAGFGVPKPAREYARPTKTGKRTANRVISNALPAWPPSRRSGALARREGRKPAIQQVGKPAPRAGASGRNRIYF
jgi:hypothetical protein